MEQKITTFSLTIIFYFMFFSSSAQNPGKANIEAFWDIKQLKLTPKFTVIDSADGIVALLYHGVLYKKRQTQVFAYYSNPDIVAGQKPSGRKFPAVVLLHGGGGTAFKQWVNKWASEGYAAIAMDLAGKDQYGKTMVNGGPDQASKEKFEAIESGDIKDVWPYQAISSAMLAHSLVLSFPEVDKNKTFLTGISWGGFLTCTLIGLDGRFKAAVPVYGCGYALESDVFKVSLKLLSVENRNLWLKYFDPSSYLGKTKADVLFINGNKDLFFNVVPYSRTYNLVDKDRRYLCMFPNMLHGHSVGWAPIEIKYFFDHILNNSKLIPKVISTNIKDSLITVSYRSKQPVTEATFYFSNDSLSTNEKRVWVSRNAILAENTAAVTIAQKRFKYAFFYFKNKTGLSFSSELIFK